MNWPVLAALAAVWGIMWYILFSGVSKGIELANKIFMPTLIVLVLFLTGRSLFLEGGGRWSGLAVQTGFFKTVGRFRMDQRVWTDFLLHEYRIRHYDHLLQLPCPRIRILSTTDL